MQRHKQHHERKVCLKKAHFPANCISFPKYMYMFAAQSHFYTQQKYITHHHGPYIASPRGDGPWSTLSSRNEKTPLQPPLEPRRGWNMASITLKKTQKCQMSVYLFLACIFFSKKLTISIVVQLCCGLDTVIPSRRLCIFFQAVLGRS